MLLEHVLHRRLSSRPHRIDRLVLLTPAGFHSRLPWIRSAGFKVGVTVLPWMCAVGERVLGKRLFGAGECLK